MIADKLTAARIFGRHSQTVSQRLLVKIDFQIVCEMAFLLMASILPFTS